MEIHFAVENQMRKYQKIGKDTGLTGKNESCNSGSENKEIYSPIGLIFLYLLRQWDHKDEKSFCPKDYV